MEVCRDWVQSYLSFISNCLFFSRASDYGLVKADARGRIIQFSEKPKGADLKAMVSPKTSQCSTTKIGYWSISERKKQKKNYSISTVFPHFSQWATEHPSTTEIPVKFIYLSRMTYQVIIHHRITSQIDVLNIWRMCRYIYIYIYIYLKHTSYIGSICKLLHLNPKVAS